MQATLYQQLTTVDLVCHAIAGEINKRLEEAGMKTMVRMQHVCHVPVFRLDFGGPPDELARAKQIAKESLEHIKKIADDFVGKNKE